MNTQLNLNKDLVQQIIYWHENHFTDEQISKKLHEKNLNEAEVQTYLVSLKKHKEQKKRTKGSLIIVAGVILLGIGFILTVSFYHSGKSINEVMYGLTTLGLILVFWGLREIFH